MSPTIGISFASTTAHRLAYTNVLQDLRVEPDAVRHALARRYDRSPVLDPSLEIRFDQP
jgi:hypothetical protein